MNRRVVDLLVAALTDGLIHPGDDTHPPTPISMPGFRTTGMTDEQAQEFVGNTATLLSEAIVALIEQTHQIIPTTDVTLLRQQAADAPDTARVISICTTPTADPVLQVTVDKYSDRVILPAAVIRKVAETL